MVIKKGCGCVLGPLDLSSNHNHTDVEIWFVVACRDASILPVVNDAS